MTVPSSPVERSHPALPVVADALNPAGPIADDVTSVTASSASRRLATAEFLHGASGAATRTIPGAPGRRACPYPGLAPFEEPDAHVFFGREGQIDDLLRRMVQHRFVAVVGPSGCGKSSLVRAGLLPALRDGLLQGAGHDWQIAVMRPGADPRGALREALLGLVVTDSEVERFEHEVYVDEALEHASVGLARAVAQLQTDRPANVLLVVDQFEELFRFGRHAGDDRVWYERASAFVSQLAHATAQTRVPVYVVITMRTEFVGHCAAFYGLPDLLNAGQYLVPRLRQQQLREAVTEPAAVFGQRFDPALVERILNDSVTVVDELPILQHALMRTWFAWEDEGAQGPLRLAHYERIGGLEGAIGKHGDEVLARLTPSQRARAELAFKRLTFKDEEAATRCPTSLAELARAIGVPDDDPDLRAVLTAFRADTCQFLRPPPNERLHASTEIDITHEAVLRVWAVLERWAEEERKDASVYRHSLEAARRHASGDEGLMRPPELTITRAWWASYQPKPAWASRYRPHDDAADDVAVLERARAFLEQSQAAIDDEAERASAKERELAVANQRAHDEAEAARARKLELAVVLERSRRLRRLVVVASFVAITLFGLLAALWQSQVELVQREAALERQRDLAEAATQAVLAEKDVAERERARAAENARAAAAAAHAKDRALGEKDAALAEKDEALDEAKAARELAEEQSRAAKRAAKARDSALDSAQARLVQIPGLEAELARCREQRVTEAKARAQVNQAAQVAPVAAPD